jgi:hypothetical protein
MDLNDDFSDAGYRRRIMAKPAHQRDEVEQAFLASSIEEAASKIMATYGNEGAEFRRGLGLAIAQKTLKAMDAERPATGDHE